MYCGFIFEDGSNPYITKTNKAFFDMLCEYDIRQTGARVFRVKLSRGWTGRKTYDDKKWLLREAAIDWQSSFPDMDYSYDDLAMWGDFFREYGKKYGLLREFAENGIC